jgi:predicted transcriptional regulator
MQVTVRDLMTPRPATISQYATIEDAIQMVLERAIDEIYVLDEDGRLAGTVSDYVLLKSSILRSDSSQPVTRVMSRSMIVLQPESTLQEVVGLFRESCYPRLAVIENGRVVGQLCRREVLRTLVVLDDLNARHAGRRIEPAAAETPPRPVSLRGSEVRTTADEAACSGL